MPSRQSSIAPVASSMMHWASCLGGIPGLPALLQRTLASPDLDLGTLGAGLPVFLGQVLVLEACEAGEVLRRFLQRLFPFPRSRCQAAVFTARN